MTIPTPSIAVGRAMPSVDSAFHNLSASTSTSSSPDSGLVPSQPRPLARDVGPLAPQAGLPDHSSQITRQWGIPPRPKPGRKPAVDAPPTKRKAQNRAAQRAFRERRAARVGELEEEVQQDKDQHEQERVAWEMERQQHLQTINDLRLNLEQITISANREHALRRKLEIEVQQMKTEQEKRAHDNASLHSHNSLPQPTITSTSIRSSWDQNRSDPQVMTPSSFQAPSGSDISSHQVGRSNSAITKSVGELDTLRYQPDDVEEPMDFTYAFRTDNKRMINSGDDVDRSAPSTVLPLPQEGCGFCTEFGMCPCKDSNMGSTSPIANKAEQPNVSVQSSKISILEPPASANGPGYGPGSCSACQSDPERRAWCQQLAGTVPPTMPRTGLTSSITSDTHNGGLELPHPVGRNRDKDGDDVMTCTDSYRQLQQSVPNFESRRESIIPQLRVHPAHGEENCGTCKEMGCAPLIVERASLAEAILLASIRDPQRPSDAVRPSRPA